MTSFKSFIDGLFYYPFTQNPPTNVPRQAEEIIPPPRPPGTATRRVIESAGPKGDFLTGPLRCCYSVHLSRSLILSTCVIKDSMCFQDLSDWSMRGIIVSEVNLEPMTCQIAALSTPHLS